MAELSKLLNTLRDSGDPDLLQLADNIEKKKKSIEIEHQEDLENSTKFCLTTSVHTDLDFYINGSFEVSFDFYGNSREEVIQKFLNFYLNEADYGDEHWIKNVAYFKKEYIEVAGEALKTKDCYSTCGNWVCDFDITEPEKDEITEEESSEEPAIAIFGISFTYSE